MDTNSNVVNGGEQGKIRVAGGKSGKMETSIIVSTITNKNK